MNRSLAPLLLVLSTLLIAGNAWAAPNLAQPDTSVQGLLDLVIDHSNEWSERLHGYAVTLLMSLAAIQLVWTFIPMVLKGADLGEIAHELVKFILVIGFFLALIQYSVEWAAAIVDSFRSAGATASGLERTLQPGDVFATAVEFSRAILASISFFSPGQALAISLSAILVLLCFAFIAAFMFVTLVESYIIINAAVIFYGFGGSQWTREFAIAPMRYAVAVGAKLFVLTLLIGLVVAAAKDWSEAFQNNEASVMTMVGLSLICAYLTKTIPELIGGMITGTSMGGGSSIGGMAAAAAAGATAAVATVATAGAAAPAATGALGAAGGSAGAGAAAGAASGAGGIAGGINSAMASGSATSGAATTSSGLGASTGGSAAAQASGARVGGSAVPSPKPVGSSSAPSSNSLQEAAKNAKKPSQDENQSVPSPSPQSTAEGSPSGKAAELASGLTRAAGIMSAISVPGMENAAGLSLDAHTPPPGADAEQLTTTADQPAETENNVIRPTQVTTLNVPGMTSGSDSQ